MTLSIQAYRQWEVLNGLLLDNNILKLNVGVEVGVRNADTSEYLLRNNPGLLLYLVDPYTPYMDIGNYFFTEEEQNKIKDKAAKRLESFKTAVWAYQASAVYGTLFESKIDFVFIDALHTLEGCRSDIRVWAPKIRPGGLLTGHDYSMAEVKQAVTEYAHLTGKSVYHSGPASDVWAMEM